jgi:PAS domain S-box-containing protein
MTAPFSDAVLSEILSISADAIICTDGAQRITFFNEGAEAIFGYAASEVLGHPLDTLLPERSRGVHTRHIERFAAEPVNARRMGERREIAGLRKSGEEFPAEAAIARVRHGADVVYSVVLRDITQRRRHELRQRFLVEVGDLLASTLDLDATLQQLARMWVPTLADAVVIEAPQGDDLRHLRAVRRAEGGVAHSDVVLVPGAGLAPISGLDAVHPPTVSTVPVHVAMDAIPALHRESIAAMAPTSATVVSLRHLDQLPARVVLLHARRGAISADDVSLMEDLARRAAMALDNARLHYERQRAVQARDDTLSVVSHDLRNPVNAVKMLAGALLTRAGSTPLAADVAEQVKVIQSAARQMDALIQDLWDMSRMEAHRFEVDVRTIACVQMLEDALRTLVPLAEEKGIRFETDWQAGLPDLLVDPDRVVQVVSNVVGNAINFTPAGGVVAISAEAEGRRVLITVRDTGPGISAGHLEHVFDRYWQSSKRSRGAGLGLPIAKAIVEAHGGRIWAESNTGAGAVFRFTLPAASD